ncbi:hypothetical protein KFU94_38850, partial [Chloroflexi bacterium TSY]|nr:hypothetical protein [Chloroflexi bacterium TSY]
MYQEAQTYRADISNDHLHRGLGASMQRATSVQTIQQTQSQLVQETGAESDLRLYLLGGFRAEFCSQPLRKFKTAKVRALLVYLAIESEWPHERSALAGLLWPEMQEQAALRNLTQTLVRVRKAICDEQATPPFLLMSRQTIQMNQASHFWVDVHDLLQGTALVQVNHHSLLEAREVAQLEALVGLYDGEFLAGFSLPECEAFEEWLLFKREQIQQQVLDILDILTESHIGLGNYSDAQQFAQQQLGIAPWRENAYRQLMTSLAYDGQRAAAMAQYEKCRQVLEIELDIEPEESTTVLYRQIKSGEFQTAESTKIETAEETPIVLDSPTLPSVSESIQTQSSQEAEAQISVVYPSTFPIRHNLPAQSKEMVGRTNERSLIIRHLLDPLQRLVTLFGMGGAGKTRLAVSVAEMIVGISLESDVSFPLDYTQNFVDGIWFVPLVDVFQHHEPERSTTASSPLVQAIASTLNLKLSGSDDLCTELISYLQNKKLMLILDNFEHLMSETSTIISLLQETHGVTILVTSRERLNISYEKVVRVDGLPYVVDPNAPDAADSPSVKLFVNNARRTSPNFHLHQENVSSIARICRLLEGFPLGIELASNWVEHYQVAEIVEAIQQDIDFLSTTHRDIPERHRSLRAVFDYSWRLLSRDEQKTLAQLSIFRGSFSREAIIEVTGANLAVVAILVDKSLLRQTAAGRYDIHERLRSFAAEKLSDFTDEKQASRLQDVQSLHINDTELDRQSFTQGVFQRYLEYYFRFSNDRVRELRGPQPRQALVEFRKEMGNIRRLAVWAVEHLPLPIVKEFLLGFAQIYGLQGLWQEGEEFLNRLLIRTEAEIELTVSQDDSSEAHSASHRNLLKQLHCNLLYERSYFLRFQMKLEEAVASGELAIAKAHEIQDDLCVAKGHMIIGGTNYTLTRYDESQKHLEKSLQILQSLPDDDSNPSLSHTAKTKSVTLFLRNESVILFVHATR